MALLLGCATKASVVPTPGGAATLTQSETSDVLPARLVAVAERNEPGRTPGTATENAPVPSAPVDIATVPMTVPSPRPLAGQNAFWKMWIVNAPFGVLWSTPVTSVVAPFGVAPVRPGKFW